MSETNAAVAGEVFTQVIEQVAFMFCDVTDKEELPTPSGTVLWSAIGFRGPIMGTLELMMPDQIGPEVASSMMGIELDDEWVPGHTADSIKELLNITCGNILTEIAGDEPIFDLTVPELRHTDAAMWEKVRNDPQSVGFMVDDTPILLRFRSEG